MDLVGKLHQRPVLEKIREMGEAYGTKSPYVVELDPTTACDLACPGCISGKLLNQKDSYDNRFQNDRLIKLVDEIIECGVKAVILIGGGEPLSHPKISEVITKLGKNDVRIGITTNGTFIGKLLHEISKYSSWTRVSMDAGTDQTFGYLRPTLGGKSKFNQIIKNMETLAKVKKGILGYSFLLRTKADGMTDSAAGLDKFGKILKSNIDEIYEAARLAKEIGCDYFEPKPSYDDDHNLVTHDPDDMKRAKDLILKAKELEDENFFILESINLEAALNCEQIGDQPKTYTTCPAVDLRTLVTPTGVYICPYFRGDPRMKIGDVRETSFRDMWQGKVRSDVLKKLNPSLDCSKLHCIRHKTNLEVNKLRKSLNNESLLEASNNPEADRFI